MISIAHAATDHWKQRGGTPDRGIGAKAFAPTQRGSFTSPQDFALEWPEAGESLLRVTYTPNRTAGLSDPRRRTVEFDMRTGELNVSDHYPAGFKAVGFVIVGLLAGGVFLLVRLGLRPLQKSTRWEGRMLAKQFEDEAAANELMAHMRNRGT